ncbi:COPII subunit [Mycoemilia scoparia]|uniref:COPII subunit n=1 Tax=Mycoemilia scoparia TaxID=417184 RepID=A0A9W7ZU87_9FUNG|nr:COPII subunit [Mycoemilia scoparia]
MSNSYNWGQQQQQQRPPPPPPQQHPPLGQHNLPPRPQFRPPPPQQSTPGATPPAPQGHVIPPRPPHSRVASPSGSGYQGSPMPPYSSGGNSPYPGQPFVSQVHQSSGANTPQTQTPPRPPPPRPMYNVRPGHPVSNAPQGPPRPPVSYNTPPPNSIRSASPFPPRPQSTQQMPPQGNYRPVQNPSGQYSRVASPQGPIPNSITTGYSQASMPPAQPTTFIPGIPPAPRTYSPSPQQNPAISQVSSPDKPASHRRRAYPEQISSVYNQSQNSLAPATNGIPATSAGGYSSTAAAASVPQPVGFQDQNLFVPGKPLQPPVSQQAQSQQQAQGQYPQQFVSDPNQLATQIGSMSLNQQSQQIVPINRINIADLELQPPPILLPQGATAVMTENAICPPEHKCCTLNAIPKTDKLLKKAKLPLGLLITPFKTQDEGEPEIPVVYEIVRCRRCRTYMNPFVKFVDGGRRWQCNLCGLVNDVPLLFDYDSVTQQPRDRWSRAELNHSVVEFVAPAEYMVRPPMPPVYVFIIDVSYPSIQMGVPQMIAETILETLDNIPNKENRTKVAFITVDSTLNFYYMKPDSSEPQMLVVSDLEDVFLPCPNDLLVDLTECRDVIESLLSRMKDMFTKNQSVGNALGPAIRAAHALLGTLGGKIIIMQSTIPSIGEGKLDPLPEDSHLGTPKESELLKPKEQWYKNMAAESSRVQIAYDTIFFGPGPKDLPSVVSLARYTGGSVFYYPDFVANRPEEVNKFKGEFSQLLSNQVGLEAVLRVRASNGLSTKAYYGNFFLRSMDLLALPNVTPNHCYAIDLSIDETLTAPVVYFQTALLYTTCYGERRIRVSTLSVPTTENIHTVFQHADQVAISALLAKKATDRALSTKLEDAREAVQFKCVEILGAFKTECTRAQTGATTDLQVPQNLQLLPLLCLSILKHMSIRPADKIPVSIRTEAINFVNTLPPDQLVRTSMLPRMYSLHDMPDECGRPDKETGIVVLPPRLPPSGEQLALHGVYLLYDGHDSYLIFGKNVQSNIYQALLNVSDTQSLLGGVISFPDLGDSPQHDLNKRTRAIMQRLRSINRNLWNPITFVCCENGNPVIRQRMMQRLVFDRDLKVSSYHQFINQVKDKINRGSY